MDFRIGRLPRVRFGRGTLAEVPALAASLGRRALIVTGRSSFRLTPASDRLLRGMRGAGVATERWTVAGEPSPDTVDRAVAEFGARGVEVVIGVGGGSVLDAAKAIAGLLPHGNPVIDHLEGVGRGVPYLGPALPSIAVPTTAGTGSEATRNAVIGIPGPDGYKKSFRDEALVPHTAVLDPALLDGCPADLIGADGLDALTQLIEGYTSTGANPLTDALALAGVSAVRDSLLRWFEGRDEDGSARERMLYAAWLSGVVLANTGLGAVHGLAAPLGARFSIPHGVACGCLLAEATRANVEAIAGRSPHSPARGKYAALATLLTGEAYDSPDAAAAALVERLVELTRALAIPRLSDYGIGEGDLEPIVDRSGGSSMQTNPIVLDRTELAGILRARL